MKVTNKIGEIKRIEPIKQTKKKEYQRGNYVTRKSNHHKFENKQQLSTKPNYLLKTKTKLR